MASSSPYLQLKPANTMLLLSPPPSPPLTTTAFSSPLLLRSPFLLSHRHPVASVRCSSASPSVPGISLAHSYGSAVDYERRPILKWSSLYRRIATADSSAFSSSAAGVVSAVVAQWESSERKVTKWTLCRVAKELRKFRRFSLALEIYDWMASQKDRFVFTASDIAIQIDLIAKVRSISHAEEHFAKVPDVLKDKRVYCALLNIYAQAKMQARAEAIFENMRSKGFLSDSLSYNVMLTLYMNLREDEKFRSLMHEMKERGVKFDIYSYNIWITNSAEMRDLNEMERVVGLMMSDKSIVPNWTTFTTLASMYARLGEVDKAQACLKDAELRLTGRDRTALHYLIGIYGNLGKKDEVYRVWNNYKSIFPAVLNIGYQTMLSSLIRVGDVDGAENIYEEWLTNASNYDPKVCNILVSWYAKNGAVDKARRVLDRLVEKGGIPKPTTWELLCEGYVLESKVQEALWCLKEAVKCKGGSNWRPRPAKVANLVTLLDQQDCSDGMEELMGILRSGGWHKREEYAALMRGHALPA